MTEQEPTQEEIILRRVRGVLTAVIKDTATPPGMAHPLTPETLAEMRECLFLISERETQLNEAAGRSMDMRPRYKDEPRKKSDEVVVQFDADGRKGRQGPHSDD